MSATAILAPRVICSPRAAFEPVTYPNVGTFARENWNERSTTLARASLRWTPTDSLTVSPVATIQRSDKANPNDFFTNLPKFENSVRFAEPTRDNLEVYSLNAAQQSAWANFVSLTGYFSRSVEWDRDPAMWED